MADSVPIDAPAPRAEVSSPADTPPPDTAQSMLGAIVARVTNFNFRPFVFLFIICILVISDAFTGTILKKVNGAVDSDGGITPYGGVIQSLVIVIGYMLADFLSSHGVI